MTGDAMKRGAMTGGVLSLRAPSPLPFWLMLGVAALQVVVLLQLVALRDRVVQFEAGAEFQDCAQGCARPAPDDPALTVPPPGLQAPKAGRGLEV